MATLTASTAMRMISGFGRTEACMGGTSNNFAPLAKRPGPHFAHDAPPADGPDPKFIHPQQAAAQPHAACGADMGSGIRAVMKSKLRAIAALPLCIFAAAAQPADQQPEIHTSDVGSFYALYDSTAGKPSAAQLQLYIDEGTDGLRAFAKMRNTTGERVALAIEQRPEIYAKARHCAAALPAIKSRLAEALMRLKEIYPEASLAPITLAVGRGKPVGVANKSGVMIGQEALCAADFMNPIVEDRFVHVIAHEFIHVQQEQFYGENPAEKVLRASLIEGGAEFIGELISGSVSYKHLPAAMKGREREVEIAFLAEKDNRAMGSAWLYNYPGTAERPADLGYWIGYRIVKAYYRKAADKRAALREIIELGNPEQLLANSGWEPGIALD
jgi:hypothetical protein